MCDNKDCIKEYIRKDHWSLQFIVRNSKYIINIHVNLFIFYSSFLIEIENSAKNRICYDKLPFSICPESCSLEWMDKGKYLF